MSERNLGLFERFEQRKQKVNIEDEKLKDSELEQQIQRQSQQINQLEDADMPEIDSLNEDSDYSVFMSEKVSCTLKKKAFRKLFLSTDINILDGLNEYDEDYTNFESLKDIMTYDLKQQLKREAEDKKRQIQDNQDNQDNQNSDSNIEDTEDESLERQNNTQNQKNNNEKP